MTWIFPPETLYFSAVEREILTITELNTRARRLIEGGFVAGVWVIGEVRSFKVHTSGNWYFVLTDNVSSVSCAMWRTRASKMGWLPEDGMKVEAFGRPTIYEKDGRYRLIIERMVPAGRGERAIAFEQLYRKLEKEGLFDPAHKKPLPWFPMVIGVVTSRTGAAIKDIVKVAKRRAPWVTIILRNTLVQGDAAPQDIAAAIDEFNRFGKVDLLIVGRGGGSEEDLWCFNDEIVARAIFNSTIPIISAVGHERDKTIADFVADYRAPTPSAAAEAAVPDRMEIVNSIHQMLRRIKNALFSRILWERNRLSNLTHRLELASPNYKLAEFRRQVDDLLTRARNVVVQRVKDRRVRVEHIREKLRLLSVDRVLERGFSIVWQDGKIIRSANQLSPGDVVRIQFAKGSARAGIEEINAENRQRPQFDES